jgi:three-Cys-motif partner protein
VAKRKGPIWDCDPHTLAKHQILTEYLDTWLPTLLSHWGRVTYAEGFAGSGVYTNGEAGSPIKALRVFARHRSLLGQEGKRVDTVLIEETKSHFDQLVIELAKARSSLGSLPPGLIWPSPRRGDHVDELLPALAELGALNEPVFAFLDSFGSPDVPLETARAIGKAPASEVLITFGTRYLIQFGTGEKERAEGDRAFGSTDWRQVFNLPGTQKKAFLVNAYRQALSRAGFQFVTSFELLDEGSHPLHLVHATSHIEGLKKMKNAMWRVDKIQGRQFRDPANADQLALDVQLDPDYAPLRSELLTRLDEYGTQTVGQLQEYTVRETIYRYQDAWGPIRDMVRDGQILKASPGQLSRSVLKLPPAVQDELF